MAILGIIAEFNPFHNGHLHLLRQASQMGDFAATVCVMSGSFLQRGDPAICNKWARARMALNSGVDLVIELPFCFAARSAYYFARGAVQLLARTGVVTHLAFGSECGSLEPLYPLSRLIASEPDEYKQALKKYLNQGLSYAAARARAVESILHDPSGQLQSILAGPNNILALEYLRVIYEESLPLIPLTIKRNDAGYHRTDVLPLSSASIIRSTIMNNHANHLTAKYLPSASLTILQEEILQGRAPVVSDTLSPCILSKLRTSSPEQLKNIYEITEGLESRIYQAAIECGTLQELKHAIKSKRYSFTRISRLLLYSLCGLSKPQVDLFDQTGPLYMHILGFSAKGRSVLRAIHNKSRYAVFNHGSDIKKACRQVENPLASMLALDIKATDIYTLLYPNSSQRKGGQDYTTSPVMIDRPM